MTDAEFNAWLADPKAIRLTLVEVAVRSAGVETTRYLSTGAFTSQPSDTPANQLYSAIASKGVPYTEQLSLTGEAGISFGDIDLDNSNGRLDSWLNDVWRNRQVQAFIGDPRWPRADFRMIFNGVVEDLVPRAREVLNLKIRDKLQRMNTPVSEDKLGGTTPNKDQLLPVMLGEVHNASALLTDPATLEYQFNSRASEGVFEVRDNGLPVAFTQFNSLGKFRLNQQSFGQVTISAQGGNTNLSGGTSYRNTVSSLVQRLATDYGKAATRLTAGDLDAANLAAFETAHPEPVGLYAAERMNVLKACQYLASSVGAQLVMSSTGLLRLIQLALPAAGTPLVIDQNDMVEKTFKIRERVPVQAAQKLGFCKNYTVQEGLLTTIPEQHKSLYATEWLESVQSDSTVQTIYRLDTEPELKETCLLRRTDADAEAARLRDLWKVPRTVYEFEGRAHLLTTELGQAVTIYNQRYGFSAGVSGMVISRSPDWQTGRIILGVLV